MPRRRIVVNQDEQEWEERRENRRRYVAEVEAMCDPGVGGQLPPHPDPEDRGLSKRAWETRVLDWKRLLRMLGYLPPVVRR